MKKIVVLGFAIIGLMAQSAWAAKVQIPKAYTGTWRTVQESCKVPKDAPYPFPDMGAQIDGAGISRYEHYCELKSVLSDSGKSFTGKFLCSMEGEESMTKITIGLTDKGYLSGLADQPMPRCK